jgi:hypothetical protein
MVAPGWRAGINHDRYRPVAGEFGANPTAYRQGEKVTSWSCSGTLVSMVEPELLPRLHASQVS